MRTMTRERLPRSLGLSLAALVAGCGLVDSGDGGAKQERIMAGILEFGSSRPPASYPSSGRVGEALTVTARTFGFCSSGYLMEGPHETLIDADGLNVQIRPRDRLVPFDGDVCSDVLKVFSHEVAVTPAQAGTLVVRILGRGLNGGERNTAEGVAVTREIVIDVVP